MMNTLQQLRKGVDMPFLELNFHLVFSKDYDWLDWVQSKIINHNYLWWYVDQSIIIRSSLGCKIPHWASRSQIKESKPLIDVSIWPLHRIVTDPFQQLCTWQKCFILLIMELFGAKFTCYPSHLSAKILGTINHVLLCYIFIRA